MIGITIGVGEPYRRMAQLAAEQFERCFGVKAYILNEAHMKEVDAKRPHDLKFRLFELFPVDDIVYFDADLVFCGTASKWSLTHPIGFSAVLDMSRQWWIRNDAARALISPGMYINSGFFWIAKERASLLEKARRAKETKEINAGFHDQTFINYAAYRTGGVNYLRAICNFHADPEHFLPEEIIGAHIHWIRNVNGSMERYYRDTINTLHNETKKLHRSIHGNGCSPEGAIQATSEPAAG